MPRYLKYALIGLGVIVLLLVVAAAILAATFDPNKYKPVIIKAVQESKQRTLSIPGEIRLTFFPKLGVSLGKLSLSERNSSATFASIDSARVSVALLPLLRKQVVVDHVRIDGIRANLKRYKDGRTNVDDLLGAQEAGKPQQPQPPQSSQPPVALDVDGISLTNADIVFEDDKEGSRFELAGASIETGRIGEGRSGKLSFKGRVKANKPAADVEASLKSDYTLELEKQRYVLKGLSAEVSGKLADLSEVKATLAGSADARLAPMNVAASDVALSASARQGTGAVQAKLDVPALKMDDKSLEIARFAADATAPNPGGGALHLTANGSASARLDKKSAAANVSGKLDDAGFNAKLEIENFSAPAYAFGVSIDKLDLDRYTPKSTPAKSSAPAKSSSPAPDTPVDLSPLKDLNARGSVNIATLKAANMTVSNVKLELRAAKGQIDINPLTADLYQGKVAGSLSAAATSPARIGAKQTLAGVSLGPLMKDAIGRQLIDGHGNVALDVTAQGATVNALKRGLNGTARFDVRDGAVHGINIAQIIRSAKSKLGAGGGSDSGSGSGDEKTDFSELSGSFKITNGVAHNDDLSAKSPLLRIAGSGDIDIGQGRLDYLVKATVANTLQGQGGPELDALRGVTVPVKLSGPFDQLAYRVDFGAVVSDKAKQELQQQREKAQSRIEQQIKDRLKALGR
jgi:AsmA protein